MSRLYWIALGLAVLVPGSARAADAPNPKAAYLTEEEAGPDFLIQGEYEGRIGTKAKLGAQVIALGDGKFNAVLYSKGLPGSGWDRSRVKLTGQTIDGSVKFTGRNFTGEIKDGFFKGMAEGDVPFELKPVLRSSPTLGVAPPEGAIVLFDGSSTDSWDMGKLEEGKLLGVGTRTKQKFRDFRLHLEFRTPFMPHARGQGRGNSGMYLLDQYEVQVLDSFGLEGLDNECGGIYKLAAPKLNMCLPPLSWQTYDVDVVGARFDETGKKTSNVKMTIRLNGVVIHDNLELKTFTPGGSQSDEKAGALYLQNHNDPVRFRNIWIVEK